MPLFFEAQIAGEGVLADESLQGSRRDGEIAKMKKGAALRGTVLVPRGSQVSGGFRESTRACSDGRVRLRLAYMMHYVRSAARQNLSMHPPPIPGSQMMPL